MKRTVKYGIVWEEDKNVWTAKQFVGGKKIRGGGGVYQDPRGGNKMIKRKAAALSRDLKSERAFSSDTMAAALRAVAL